ncbi:MAG TPA: RDD family protein [Elusimicrobiota bacterium]|nr:RDD family protein [Elusimicrobiota bacterium]
MASPETRHLSILLTDIKGFTDKTSHKTRADIQAMLDEHRAIVLPILEGAGGRLIKTIGDAFLMTYDSPTNAVLAGVAVQEALAKRNEGKSPDDRLEIRIAINAGEVNLAEGDVFGEPVNITARIEGIAEAGQVYFTEAVYLAMNKAEVPSSEIGLMQLKGIPEKIRVYKVRREEPVGATSAKAEERRGLLKFLPPLAEGPAAFGPGVKAIPAGAATSRLPSSWRRAAALCIDGILCSMILGFFVGSRHSRKLHISKKLASVPTVDVDDKGMKINGPDTKLAFDDSGIHGQAGDTNIAIDEHGIHVDPKAKPQKVVYQNPKSGVKVSVDDDGDKDADEDDGGSFARRFMSGRWDFAIVWFVYSLVFLKWLSASPGKQLLKLKVVSVNGQPVDKRQRMLRAGFSLISGYAMFLGYLWALWEPQRRTWHDLVAGTRVVPAE